MTDDERQELKDRLLMADLTLKTKQAAWETPRNVAILAGAVAAIAAALGGWTGYKIASAPSAASFTFPPGTTITVPATPAPK